MSIDTLPVNESTRTVPRPFKIEERLLLAAGAYKTVWFVEYRHGADAARDYALLVSRMAEVTEMYDSAGGSHRLVLVGPGMPCFQPTEPTMDGAR